MKENKKDNGYELINFKCKKRKFKATFTKKTKKRKKKSSKKLSKITNENHI